MPKITDIQKILVIGSGPIIIGQAAEFDYSGTQACKALKEEGYEVVLINSNPATIMTDVGMADKVYIEPITLDTVIRILKKEKPQGIIATLGGQTGLNMAIELDSCGILPKLGIRLLGTQLDSIKLAEDRELFKDLMVKTGQKTTHSTIVTSLEEAEAFSHECDFPLIVRPAYTLGGTGGGTAHNMDELMDITARGLKMSLIHQVLMEQSVAGWKEIEYEVIRDNADNCIIVCNMENIDPVGVHTGCLLYTSMLIYSLVVNALGGTAWGWTSMIMSIWLLGGLQLLAIGIIGEYVGKTYMEAKKRPKYLIETVLKDE